MKQSPIIKLSLLLCTYDNGETANWKMGEWKQVDDEVVLFSIQKPNFTGVITVKEMVNPLNKPSGVYAVGFKHESWFFGLLDVVEGKDVVSFINNIGGAKSEVKAVGERAPVEGCVSKAA